MAINSCEACESLKQVSFDTAYNGITDKECASLKKNFGLNQELDPAHNNCDDLATLTQCLLGQILDELPKYNTCNWRDGFSKLVKNLYQVVAAMQCGDCGQWDEIDLLWEETQKLWAETQKLWEETYKIWAELYKVWSYVYELEARITSLESRMTQIENRVTIIEGQIRDIYQILADIQIQIEALSGTLSYTTLVAGTDFVGSVYNGFEQTSATSSTIGPNIQFAESSTQAYVTVGYSSTDSSRHYIRHRNLIASDVRMRHSNSASAVTQSWIGGFTFRGNYSWMNTATFRSVSTTTTGIWNLLPQGHSWQANASINRGVTGADQTFVISWVQYADGYNSQLSAYGEPVVSLSGMNFSRDLVFIKP